MPLAYRVEPNGTLTEMATEDVGSAPYIVVHPAQIERLRKSPEALREARLFPGICFLIPSTNTAIPDSDLFSLLT